MPWLMNVGESYVEKLTPETDTVCISISEPNRAEKPRLPKGFVDVLRLEFQDYDPLKPYRGSNIVVGAKIPDNAVLFTSKQAAGLARFARKHRGKNILVHCAAGISRSGGVVEALLEAFPEYEDKGWPRYPNNHVKTTLKRALGLVPIGFEESE